VEIRLHALIILIVCLAPGQEILQEVEVLWLFEPMTIRLFYPNDLGLLALTSQKMALIFSQVHG